jgi:hypothetical protein
VRVAFGRGGGSGGIVGDWTGAFAALVTSDVSYRDCGVTGEGGGSGGSVGDWTGAFAALVTSDVSYRDCGVTDEGVGQVALLATGPAHSLPS